MYMLSSQNPYKDYVRVIDKKLYHARLFNNEAAIEILQLLGFDENDSCMYYSYDKDAITLKVFREYIEKTIIESVNDTNRKSVQ